MTKKQKTTLLLFAQNYSLRVIAEKQGVCLATIRERIESLSKNHSKEFNNAANLRKTYKRNQESIRNAYYFDYESEDLAIRQKF